MFTASAAREEVRQAVEASDPEGYAQVCEAMVDASHLDPDYSAIVCPAMFISGQDDAISPPSRAQELAQLLGGDASVRVVKGGHQPILSDLEATSQATLDLIDKVAVSEKRISV